MITNLSHAPSARPPLFLAGGADAPAHPGWPRAGTQHCPDLFPGIAATEMVLSLQPRHALAGGMLRAAEASPRWGLAVQRAADAAEADKFGWIGSWLLHQACAQASRWNAGPPAAPIAASVDMPPRALRDGRLLAQTCEALETVGLAPHLLEIEIPEYAVSEGGTEMLLALSALRDLGVGLALDHFGSVSASLRLLRRLPLTAVKLDPCLTRHLVYDREARATVAAAIDLAHALDVSVVATGVDTPAQRDILADLECDDAQGALFGPAMLAEDFCSALEEK